MDGKIKIIIAVAAVAAIGMAGYSKLSGDLNQDPPITSLQAEFVGEVKPGQTFTRGMFDVRGVTESGKIVQLHEFSSETEAAAVRTYRIPASDRSERGSFFSADYRIYERNFGQPWYTAPS